MYEGATSRVSSSHCHLAGAHLLSSDIGDQGGRNDGPGDVFLLGAVDLLVVELLMDERIPCNVQWSLYQVHPFDSHRACSTTPS